MGGVAQVKGQTTGQRREEEAEECWKEDSEAKEEAAKGLSGFCWCITICVGTTEALYIQPAGERTSSHLDIAQTLTRELIPA